MIRALMLFIVGVQATVAWFAEVVHVVNGTAADMSHATILLALFWLISQQKESR